MPAKSLRRSFLTRLLWVLPPVVLIGITVHWHLESELLQNQFDEALVERAKSLAALMTRDRDRTQLEVPDEYMPEYSRDDGTFVFEAWTPNGETLERSASLGEDEIPFCSGTLQAPAKFEFEGGPGRAYRGASVAFPSRHAEEGELIPSVVIAVAGDRELLATMRREGYAEIAVTELISVLGVLLALGLASVQGIRTLEKIAAEVETITPDSLATSMSPDLAPVEIRPIIASLNRSLGVIRTQVEREQRFNADVAHELRTPIAELRAAADVALRWPDHESLGRLAKDAQAIAVQMGGLVDSLLSLATLESAGKRTAAEPFDLSKKVALQVDQANRRAVGGRRVIFDEGKQVRINSDPELWEISVGNLLENALAYSPEESQVRVRLETVDAGVRLQISNPTDELQAKQIPHCTERLWRADPAVDTGHHGLGLSIVQAACTRIGYRLTVDLTDGIFVATIAHSDRDEPIEYPPI